LVELLAKEFNIAKKDIEIVSGKGSKNKIVRLTGVKKQLYMAQGGKGFE